MVGLMAGLVLLALAALRAGRFAQFLPTSVIEGFTAGIAVVIALQQVPAALGVTAGDGEKVWQVAAGAVAHFAAHPAWAAPLMALAVAAVMLAGARLRPGVPFSLLGVAVATLGAQVFSLDVARIGALPAGLPAPSLGFLDPGMVGTLLPSALAVAALAALESLLCATVADGMSVGERHDPDRELFGQGIANLAAPVLGGVPATAAIARTAVNVRAGPGPGWRRSPTPPSSPASCSPPALWSAGSRSRRSRGCCWPPPSAWSRSAPCGRWPARPAATPPCSS